MGYSIEVNGGNFRNEVIAKSFEKLVLVDFFATWCGPCKLLKPVLEKLAKEYDFIFAKVDIDENQDLANQYNVEGVPDVRLFTKGEMLPGFVGVLQESQIRDLLEKLNITSSLENGLKEAQTSVAMGDIQTAKQIYDSLFEIYPDNSKLIIEAAKFLIRCNQLDAANNFLNRVNIEDREYALKVQGIKALIQFKLESDNPGESELDQLYTKAARLAIQEEYEKALKIFLSIVSKNRQYKQDGARKAMLAIFNLLGKQHRLTQVYQQELMLTLY